MSHTPGPWRADTKDTMEIYGGSPEMAIAELWLRGDRETEVANATLIACAPDMLEFIKNCGEMSAIDFDMQRKILIAKAEGKT